MRKCEERRRSRDLHTDCNLQGQGEGHTQAEPHKPQLKAKAKTKDIQHKPKSLCRCYANNTLRVHNTPLFREIVKTLDSLSVVLADTVADSDCHGIGNLVKMGMN